MKIGTFIYPHELVKDDVILERHGAKVEEIRVTTKEFCSNNNVDINKSACYDRSIKIEVVRAN